MSHPPRFQTIISAYEKKKYKRHGMSTNGVGYFSHKKYFNESTNIPQGKWKLMTFKEILELEKNHKNPEFFKYHEQEVLKKHNQKVKNDVEDFIENLKNQNQILPEHKIENEIEKLKGQTVDRIGAYFGANMGGFWKDTGKHLVCIDIDRCEEELDENGKVLIEDGLKTWKKVIKRVYNTEDEKAINTPSEISQSGGFHYFYLMDHKTYKELNHQRIIKILVDNQQTAIDFIGKDAIHISPTFTWRGPKMGWRSTKWIEGKALGQIEPQDIPQEFIDFIKHTLAVNGPNGGVSGKNKGKGNYNQGKKEKNNYPDRITPKIPNMKDLEKIFNNIRQAHFDIGHKFEWFTEAVIDSTKILQGSPLKDPDNIKEIHPTLKVLIKVSKERSIEYKANPDSEDFELLDRNFEIWIEKSWIKACKPTNKKHITTSYDLFTMIKDETVPDLSHIKAKYLNPNPIEQLPESAFDYEFNGNYVWDEKRKNCPVRKVAEKGFSTIIDEETFEVEKSIMVIKSAMGSGKNFMLKELLKKHDPEGRERILVISTRRAFSRNLTYSMQDYNFTCYLNEEDPKNPDKPKTRPEDVYSSDRLICQIESLPKLYDAMRNQELRLFDCIIMDESESILSHFSSQTLNSNRLNIFNFMTNLIKASHFCIVMDADYSVLSHNYFKKIRKPIVIRNNKVRDEMKRSWAIKETVHKDDTMEHIFGEMKKHKKIAICCTSASTADYIGKQIEDSKDFNHTVKCFTSTTCTKEKRELANANEVFAKADIIIYTSVISVGVDCDKVQFDKIIAVMQTNGVDQRTLIQMTGRCRWLKNKEILGLALKIKWIRYHRYDSYMKIAEREKNYNCFADYQLSEYCKKANKLVCAGERNNDLYEIYIRNIMAEENKQTSRVIEFLIFLLEDRGIKYTYEKYNAYDFMKMKIDDWKLSIKDAVKRLEDEKKYTKEELKIKQKLLTENIPDDIQEYKDRIKFLDNVKIHKKFNNFMKGTEYEVPNISIASQKILEAKDIDEQTYDEIEKNAKAKGHTQEETFQILKYRYAKDWEIPSNRIDVEFIKKYNSFTKHTLSRFKKLFNGMEYPNSKIVSNNTPNHTRKEYKLLSMLKIMEIVKFKPNKKFKTMDSRNKNYEILHEALFKSDNNLFDNDDNFITNIKKLFFKNDKKLIIDQIKEENIIEENNKKIKNEFEGMGEKINKQIHKTINKMLKQYGLNIINKRKTLKGRRQQIYKLKALNEFDLMYYKEIRECDIADHEFFKGCEKRFQKSKYFAPIEEEIYDDNDGYDVPDE